MPRDYVKKKRPKSYYTLNGLTSLKKAIYYFEQVGDLKHSQTLEDLNLFVVFFAEYHGQIEAQEKGIINLTEQTKLETPEPEILKELRK